MHALGVSLLAGFLALLGLVVLIKSIGRLIAIYTAGPRIEWPAQLPTADFDLKEPGHYEISVKRPSFFGLIQASNAFRLTNRQTGVVVAVDNYNFLLSNRTDLSGTRIVPVAAFAIEQPGSFQLINPSTSRFTEKDKLLVSPKAGIQGVLMIIATVFSSILLLAGFVFFILSLIKK